MATLSRQFRLRICYLHVLMYPTNCTNHQLSPCDKVSAPHYMSWHLTSRIPTYFATLSWQFRLRIKHVIYECTRPPSVVSVRQSIGTSLIYVWVHLTISYMTWQHFRAISTSYYYCSTMRCRYFVARNTTVEVKLSWSGTLGRAHNISEVKLVVEVSLVGIQEVKVFLY